MITYITSSRKISFGNSISTTLQGGSKWRVAAQNLTEGQLELVDNAKDIVGPTGWEKSFVLIPNYVVRKK